MDITQTKPRFRGRFHQVAFFLSVPAGLSLVALAQGALARVGALVYAISLSGLYAVSATFHRINWRRPRAFAVMRHLDHSMIFVLIAGTYTPFALLVLPPPWSTVILAAVWGGAATGIAIRLITRRSTAIQHTLYILLGWSAVFTLPITLGRVGWIELMLMLAGGLLYTVGALLFLLRRPDPNPAVFGYHEVWHSMVCGASLCHYAMILLLILPG